MTFRSLSLIVLLALPAAALGQTTVASPDTTARPVRSGNPLPQPDVRVDTTGAPAPDTPTSPGATDRLTNPAPTETLGLGAPGTGPDETNPATGRRGDPTVTPSNTGTTTPPTANGVDPAHTRLPGAAPTNAPWWRRRRGAAVVLSSLIPGAGQTYLGAKLKGGLFSAAAFGGILAAVLANDAFQGEDERLVELQRSYLNAPNYATAQARYDAVTKGEQDRDHARTVGRTAVAVTAAVWAANLIDLSLLTREDGSTKLGFTVNRLSGSGTAALGLRLDW